MSAVDSFRKKHGISSSESLMCIKAAIESADRTRQIVVDAHQSSNHQSSEHELLSLIHVNLLCRIFDQIDGMLLCISGGIGQSSEALARVVVESAVTTKLVFSHKDVTILLIGYLDAWHIEHEKQIKTWKSLHDPTDHGGLLHARINSRLDWIQEQSEFIDAISETFCVNRNSARNEWKKYGKLISRFEALGRKPDYYSVYHRLSASSHHNAEETVSWLRGFLEHGAVGQSAIERESFSYSVMMAHIATTYVLEAAMIHCAIHLRYDYIDEIKRCISGIENVVSVISESAGVPRAEI